MAADSLQLKSDLARMCLPRPEADHQRALAWTNSVCLLFLLAAWSGVQPGRLIHKALPPVEEPVPIIVQPLPQPPPPQNAAPTEAAPDQTEAQAAPVVAVALESPAINFSVPTIGNVIVPAALAAPPPVIHLAAAAAPAPAPEHHEPTSIGSTGQGGDRPQPPYPEMALKMGQQGTVVLLMTVDDAGLVQSITVKETSGSPILDRAASEFVKRHWIVPPGAGGRRFQAAIAYRIQTD